MKTIELTSEQREKLMNALSELRDTDGKFEIEIFIGCDLIIEAKGSVEVEAYQEDDYFSGTGAWVETRRSAWVELTAYDENGEECYVDALTEQEADEYLNQAA